MCRHRADVAAPVVAGIGVEPLDPLALARHADAQAVVHRGREVAQHQHRVGRRLAMAHECQHAACVVVMVYPLETVSAEVTLVQRRQRSLQGVQIGHQPLHAGVCRVAQQVPIQAAVMVPFARLRKLAAHEHQLLARVAPHEAVISAQVGELLPAVAWHLAQQRPFAVHHLVVRERQHEVLVEGVDEAKAQLTLVMAAVDGVARDVGQGVVHPAHVPFVMKPQAAGIGRSRDRRKCGGLLGQRDRLWPLNAHHLVQALQEADRLQVLASAVHIGNPFARLAAVVAVQHRGHGVDAQPVDAETFQPVQRVADQEVAHLGAAQVADQRVPVGVVALARIGVLVQVGAVEQPGAMGVGGEMRGHPVQDHTQAGGVRFFDKVREASRVAKARGRCIQAQRLVAPGAVEGVLADRQQLDVAEAQAHGIRDQRVGEFIPVQPAVAVLGLAPPRAQVHFVDADGRTQRIGGLACGRARHRRGQRRNDAGGGRAQFGGAGHRIGFLWQALAEGRVQFVFVARTAGHAWDEQLPDAAFAPQPHRVAGTTPVVEIADHADAGSIRCPDGKAGARDALVRARGRPQHLVRPQVGAFGQQPGVDLTQQGAEAIGVFGDLGLAISPGDVQAVGCWHVASCQRDRPFVDTVSVAAQQRAELARICGGDHGHRAGAGQECPHPGLVLSVPVQPQQCKWIAAAAVADQGYVFVAQHGCIVRCAKPGSRAQACGVTRQICSA